MTQSSNLRNTLRTVTATLAVMAGLASAPAAQSAIQKTTSPSIVPLVPVALLEPFLPKVDGWTQGLVDADTATLSDTCKYTYAYARYTNAAGSVVRVTVADTGRDPGGLGAMATMVTMFADGYIGQIPPSTTISRLKFKGSPAAALWDAKSNEGEFTVVVNGRFIAKAEGKGLESDQVLRALIDAIDLKALGELGK